MKKIILIILTISLLFAACGSSGTEETQNQAEESSAEISVSSKEPDSAEAGKAQSAVPGEAPVTTPEAEPAYLKERTGRYYLNRMQQAGVVMGAEEIARVEGYGIEMTLILKHDGTGMMKVFGEEWDFTWDEQEFRFKEETSEYRYENKEISFTKEGIGYLFTIVKPSDLIKPEEEEEPDQTDEDFSNEDTQEEARAIAAITVVGADWVKLAGTTDRGLCIWYEFTNLTEGYLSPYEFEAEITQDDRVIAEGEEALSEKESIPEDDFRFSDVQPGGTNRCIHLFKADPYGGKIQYTVKDAAGGGVLLQEELDPKKLAGRPIEDFEPEAVLDLDYLDKVPAKDVYNEAYELSIKTAETVYSETDKSKMIRVQFEFKNGSSESVSPYLVVYLRAVQDGICLSPGWSSLEDPELILIYEEVEPGESAKFYYEWHLISDSPVAVEVYDWFSEETVLGRAFEVKEEE